MKFDKKYQSLLAGLIDEDELEETRYDVSKQLERRLNEDVKETSFNTNVLLEFIGFNPGDDEDPDYSDHAKHPEDPNGWKFVDQDANDPEEYEEKIEDEQEYSHASKIGQRKVREHFKKKITNLVNKYTLNEDWKEQVDLPGELDDAHKSFVKVPQGLLDQLSAWKGRQGSASNTVLTVGSKGVPVSYLKKAISELDTMGAIRHKSGHLSSHERTELVDLINQLNALIDTSSGNLATGPMETNMPSHGGMMKEDEVELLQDEDSGGSDLVAAIIGGQGLLGVSSDPSATNVDFWPSLSQNNNWELIWLNDVPVEVQEKLKNWQNHFASGREAASSAVPYMGEVIADNSGSDLEEPSMDWKSGPDSKGDLPPRTKGSIEQYF